MKQNHIPDASKADRHRLPTLLAWVSEGYVEGQLIDGRPRRIWWENKQGIGNPIYAAPQPAESAPDCPESDKWNCKYCRRVNSCPVKHLRDAQPADHIPDASKMMPECPYPCGWESLHKMAIHDGAYLAKSLEVGQLLTDKQRSVAIVASIRLIEVCRAMLSATPKFGEKEWAG